MMRISCLLLLGLFACNGGGDPEEVEDLTRRVSQLEKRVKSLEQAGKGGKSASKGKSKGKKGREKSAKAGGDKGKGDKAKGKGDKGKAEGASVSAEGDAARVVLAQGKKRMTLPGKVGAGTYTVMAVFGEAPLAKAGEITVDGKKAVKVTCTSADKTCKAGG